MKNLTKMLFFIIILFYFKKVNRILKFIYKDIVFCYSPTVFTLFSYFFSFVLAKSVGIW